MLETRIPGTAAFRAVIVDEGRAIHGDGGAFNKAAVRLLAEYDAILQRRGEEKGVNYHLVLVVEDTKGTKGCGNCGNDFTVVPEDEAVNICEGCKDGSNWKPRVTDPSKTPTEALPRVKDPAPHLTQAEKDAGFDGK